ncbi:nucleotidyltransferase [Candidatus Micrarchaeota archaeon]|nr:nucleotidyltransferase [Candidatus Micrarchaeota archaeon]MBU2477407.1 nucleotidyltransferase [Candidatus Micrarchaeota archaeon]
MEFEFKGNTIKFQRELSNLDKLVIKFTKILEKQEIDYVIISGYIAILFGRSRNTEDIDLFIEEMSFEKFKEFWTELEKQGFECIIESDPKQAYYEYLKNQTPVRFAIKGTFLPNFELKFAKTKYNFYSLKHKVKVIVNKEKLNIPELEMQIAFKLKLGSEKDFEDARHLYKVFKESLDMKLLENQIRELKVEKEAEERLWKKV